MSDSVYTETPEKSGWRNDEIEILDRQIKLSEKDGESLRPAFERTASLTGRKPNSVRNYYYTTYRREKGDPPRRTFETFSGNEIEDLLRYMLTARAKGKSIRQASLELGEGDYSKMLRCQNKYRSLVSHRPELVHAVVEQLRADGVDAPDPCAYASSPSVSLADEAQTRRAIAGIWGNILRGLEKLPVSGSLDLVRGLSQLVSLAVENNGGDAEALRHENERLRREYSRLQNKPESERAAAGTDRRTANMIHAARRIPGSIQNTSDELTFFPDDRVD